MTRLFSRGQIPEVLVIDDNRGDALLIQIAFRATQTPGKITMAATAEAGMSILLREEKFKHCQRPDLILLDLNLTQMSGLTFLSLVKKDRDLACIPVIVLSSSASESEVLASYASHASGYLTKPINLDGYNELVTVLANYWFRNVHTPMACEN
jgi:chemotaxis family two-component system response regulator Rcp1